MSNDGTKKVTFVGAGPGAKDLITVRGMRLLEEADVIVYAGSLVNPELLSYAGESCALYNSAILTHEECMEILIAAVREGKKVVRLHTGDPSLYGAIREQIDALEEEGIECEVCPGVSAAFGAAASLGLEYTLPEIAQSLILTRMAGRTAVPESEEIEQFAAHRTTMAIYLSAGMAGELSNQLIRGGYPEDTPAAIVYKATWPEEKTVFCTVGTLEKCAGENGITKTAVILVGDVIGTLPAFAKMTGNDLRSYARSKLYDASFTTEYRHGNHDDHH